MSEREKNPGEYPSLLFLEEKVRLAQWRVDMVCKQVRHEVAKLNGPIEPLGQLVEMRSELTKVTKALQEATEAFVLNRLTHSNARLTNGDFEKLMRHEKQATTLQWELTNHIWYISSSRGDIDKLVSHGLNALQMYKKSSDKHGATKDIRERRTPSPSPSDSESP